MPRTSIENLMVKESGLAADLARPDAPYDLCDEGAGDWRRIVNSMPGNHFIPANYHMLTLLCQHLVESRRLSRLIHSYCQKKDNANVSVYLEIVRQKAAEDKILLIIMAIWSCEP